MIKLKREMSWFVTVDIAISKLSGKLFNVQNLVDFKIEG